MSAMFTPRPEPKTPLGRHRVLSPTAGVKVSPLCLGAMNFGESWKEFMGECTKETAFEMLDFFYESGGNFIDTANNYQKEESEEWVGEWLEKRGVRDEMVIATKFTSNYKMSQGDEFQQQGNYTGNSHKSLHLSLEASLKKLKTTYIDLLYLHWWDFTTSIEEVMQSLNRMVLSGKVLYLGVSDTPAWIVSKANQYARDHGLKQFSVYQGQWNAAERDMEAEIIPMAHADGMAICPWGALGGGKFKTKEQLEKKDGRQMGGPSEKHLKVAAVLEKIAKAKGTIITSVAMAYVMHQSPDVYPIVGGRNVEHLKGNIEALKLRLTPEEIKEIEGAYGYAVPFPLSMLYMGQDYSLRLNAGSQTLTKAQVFLDAKPNPAPVLF